MLRNVLLLACLFGCTGDDDGDKDENAETDADTDTDADADADADTDTDPQSYATYEEFVAAHARAYCGSLETCELLDDRGYADRQACIDDVTTRLGEAPCPDYQADVAGLCVAADRDMANRCSEVGTGAPPGICQNVCEPPPE
ncbi:MAG: hypothetical protein ACOZNI_10615 [Myxococcota bacterium]